MTKPSTFPRRNAITRRFSLGAPRDVRISDDGHTVMFLRSNGPEDAVNRLWSIDVSTGDECLIADPAELGADEHNLPAEERARRERARESGGGIVAYDVDAPMNVACFALGGQVGRADLRTATAELLPSAAGAFDPRISPDGLTIAYVADDALRLIDGAGDRELVGDALPTVSWGAAEFIAGEEMGRTRGFWWSPTSDRLLVERVDVEPVASWWIAAPVTPEIEPRRVRYPAAGTANASVELALVGIDGEVQMLDWNDGRWEYLADASWTGDGLILTVQTRDQRTLAVLDVDLETGAVTERTRLVDDHWIDLVPGAPRLFGTRLVTVEDRGAARRVCVDGVALSGDDLQVRRLVSVDDDGIVVLASTEPTSVDIVRVGWDATTKVETSSDAVCSVVGGKSTRVVSRRSMDPTTDGTWIETQSGRLGITDHREQLDMSLQVSFHRLGHHQLATALVLPSDHDGSPLPVLLDPYGGPHAQRVQQAAGLFFSSQWFADQGFAVLVVDGRGTPGRGPAFEREVWGDLSGPVLEDQIDALHAAAEIEPLLDLSRVAMRGWSFGGYLSALAVLRRPDVVHAAVAGAPVTDWRLYDTHYTERYLGHPNARPDHYQLNDLCTIPTALGPQPIPPLLLIHGLADDNVVAAHTLQLSRALLEAGKAHSVLPLSGVTHMTPQESVAENLLLLQLSFLRDALGIDDPRPAANEVIT